MKIHRLYSLNDYKNHVELNKDEYPRRRQYEKECLPATKGAFAVPGISYPANKFVDFIGDYQFSDGIHVNWRERLVCPVTGLNNRLRASAHLLDIELAPYTGSKIYITEQVTPFFQYLQPLYPNVLGSEFLDPGFESGTVHNNIRHEDMTRHSFASGSLDHYLSFECFEHIPFYEKAIHEIHRTLKPGGVFFGSFPFDINAERNLIKATLDKNGEIIYFTEPEYHGDPVNEKGILCYTIFGWEALEQFRQAGFTDVYLVLLWSDVFGYLGGEQVFFVARK